MNLDPVPAPTLSPRAEIILSACDNQDADYQAVLAMFKWRAEEALRVARVAIRDELRAFLEHPPRSVLAKEAAAWDRRLLTLQSTDRDGGFGHRNLPWIKAEWDRLHELYAMPVQLERLGNVGARVDPWRRVFQAECAKLAQGE